VKPAPFEYRAPRTTTEALQMLAEWGDEGRVLAGGQSLVPLMTFRLAQPSHLVDINRIDELNYIRAENGWLAVGACARQAAVERSPDAARQVPLIVEALGFVAHEPVRNRGTVVGSIAHADPAAELPSVALALDAELRVASQTGERQISAADFLRGPFQTALEPGEVVTEVRFPFAPLGSGYAFAEFSRRHGDFAIAGTAVFVQLEGDRVARTAIVLCGVAASPVRAREAVSALQGDVPTAEAIEAAAQRAVEGLRPSSDLHGSSEYRRNVARAQVRRALTLAVARARGEGA
jgi:carbon-monoxide dehydrogenase medium subunit